MKTKKIRIRQGFTIVELVIVIGVIGVLAAVLIPTFVNLNNKANRASDESLVKNLNTALAMQEQDPQDTKNATMQDAVEDLKEYGYLLPNLVTKTGDKLLWNQQTNRFLLENDSKGNYKDIDFWRIQDSIKGDETYSIYAGLNFKGNGADESIVNVTVGFDAGYHADLSEINYTRLTGAAEEAIIRSASFSSVVNVNAPSDTVKHYGNASIVNVEKIAGASYHENGTVGRLIVEEGHAVAEENALVFCLIDAGTAEAATVEVKTGAVVYDENGEDKGQEAVVDGVHDDCGAGNHDYGSQLVIDNKVYEVCKSCGYTLVRVVDFAGVETLTTMVDEDGEIVSSPAETYNSTATDSNGNVVQGKEAPAVEAPSVETSTDTTCAHEFEGTVTIEATCQQPGVKTFTCTKCGSKYTSTINQLAHNYYDNAGHEHTSDETCTMCGHVRGTEVAVVNGTSYTTLTDALAAVPTDGTQTTIKLVNDDAIRGNGGWVIGQNQNVVLDLNGYTLKNLVTDAAASRVICNKGTLSIIDSSDTEHKGTGTGKIFVQSATENTGSWPTYNWATNAILNDGGTLNIYGGSVECSINGGLGYCVDTSSNSRSAIFNFFGGRLIGGNADQAVRVHFNASSLNNEFNMTGGVIESGGFWVYHNPGHYTGHCTVNISGGEINGFIDLKDNGDTSINISGGVWNFTKLRLRDSDTNATDNFVHISGGTLNTLEGFTVDDQRTTGDGGIEILPTSTATVSGAIPLGAKA